VQLALGLLLAYILFQNLRGKTLFRMIFFIPYITPAVAAATVFRIIFSARPSSLANQGLGLFGIEPQKWIAESDPFITALFGIQLDGFFSGPSMSLVSTVMLGVWMYVGYNTIIYLAGLGQIPGDLYEAARVDGASDWHIFRYITLPLLSPVTFYLSVLGFIGTFKSFNTIFVMRVPEARGTTDTAAIVIFDTFRKMTQYGEATAQAIILMFIILAITQFQRSFLEKRVFYG
jgi:multiple sugar transport system permease protein